MKKYMPFLLIVFVLLFSALLLSPRFQSPPVTIFSPSPSSASVPTETPRPSPTPTPVPTLSPQEELVAFASQFEGYPYAYGEESPEKGFDCSGLVFYVYDHFGYPLYRTASDMRKNGEKVETEDLQTGDILLFKRGSWIYHCGIYLGNGSFIHAQDEAHGVVITPLADYSDRGLEIRRMIGTMEPFSQEPLIATDPPAPTASSVFADSQEESDTDDT